MKIKKLCLLAATLLFTSTSVFANMEMDKNMSKEDRAKMADMHSKMADCLKSDKPMSECKTEMMDSCKDMGNACQMMGKDHKMKKSKK